MKYISISFSGRARIIVDGDVQNAKEYEGSFSGNFAKTVEVRNLDSLEDQGAGSAQPYPRAEEPQ